jgi:hypothetical protein
MSVLKEKATEISKHIKNPNPQFSITTILTIISIIIGIIQIYQKCKKTNQQIIDAMKAPSYADKILLRRKIRQAARIGQLNASDVQDIQQGFTIVGASLDQKTLELICQEIKEGAK